MGVSSNRAYQGHILNDDVVVFYADRHRLAHWNRGRSRVHPDNWKAGWYWREANEDGMNPGHGPFTSSRLAYKDAMS